jgi:cytochrome c-type biogenesis protein CcmH
MSERATNILIVVVITIMAVGLAILVATGPAENDRVREIGSRIKCPVCQGESIADSPSQMAEDMMALVEEKVAQGASDDQIIDDILASYSGAVLLDPPLSGITLWLWLAPVAAIGAGVVVILWWRRHPTQAEESEPAPRSRKRTLVGGLMLVAGFVVIVVVAGTFLQEREGATAGVVDLAQEDLSDVSNETMEAVIAANLDNPQINGMRLALAERYFEAGDYRSAFPHYLAVAESQGATNIEAASALTRLGWMAFEGNGEVETANRLLDEALAIEPGAPVALYLKGRVQWCGAGDAGAAVDLFEQVLDTPDLGADSRADVEADLALARAGEACP